MKIYAFSGLGADQRIFSHLNINAEIIPINWIDPEANESLMSYAHRLSDQIDVSAEFGLLGVSFGGMLVSELCKTLKPTAIILISSSSTKFELPWITPVCKKWNLPNRIPHHLLKPPGWITWFGFPFNKNHRTIAKGIIQDTDSKFVQWALTALFNWENEKTPDELLHIRGRWDPIIPLQRRMNAVVVGTGHFVVLKKSKEISTLINQHLEELTK